MQVSVEEACGRVGTGRFQLQILLVVGMTFIADMAEIICISILLPTLPSSEPGWRVTATMTAGLASVVMVGFTFGASLWGTVSDRMGRRTAVLGSAATTLVAGLASSFAPEFYSLVVLRGIVGVGVAGAHVSVSLFMEFLPVRGRGLVMTSVQVFWAVGGCLQVGIGWLTVGDPGHRVFGLAGWRSMLLLTCVPVVVLLVCCLLVPESPRWLVVNGREDDAKALLERAGRLNGRPFPASWSLLPVDCGVAPPKRPLWKGVLELMAPGVRTVTLTSWITWSCCTAIYYSLLYLAPVLLSADFHHGHLDKPAPSSPASAIDFRQLMISNVSELPGVAVSVVLFVLFSRRTTMVILLAATVASFGVIVAASTSLTVPKWLLLAGVTAGRIFGGTAYSVVAIFSHELFPTSLRSQGIGSSSSVAHIVAALVPFLAYNMFDWNPMAALATVLVVAAICLVTVILSKLEAKGKPLPNTVKDVATPATDKAEKLLSDLGSDFG